MAEAAPWMDGQKRTDAQQADERGRGPSISPERGGDGGMGVKLNPKNSCVWRGGTEALSWLRASSAASSRGSEEASRLTLATPTPALQSLPDVVDQQSHAGAGGTEGLWEKKHRTTGTSACLRRVLAPTVPFP